MVKACSRLLADGAAQLTVVWLAIASSPISSAPDRVVTDMVFSARQASAKAGSMREFPDATRTDCLRRHQRSFRPLSWQELSRCRSAFETGARRWTGADESFPLSLRSHSGDAIRDGGRGVPDSRSLDARIAGVRSPSDGTLLC